MKYHNRNSRNNDKRYLNKKKAIDAVNRYLSDIYFRAIDPKTDYTRSQLDKLKTQIIRESDIIFTGDPQHDSVCLENLLDKDFFTQLVKQYADNRIDDKYNSKAIVECVNLKIFIEKMFGIGLDPGECGIDFDYDVFCPCGEKTVFTGDIRLIGAIETDEEFIRSNKRKTEKYTNWTTGEYRCPKCGRKCFTHMGTKVPYGIPADKKTRKIRMRLHAMIEPLYDSPVQRKQLYHEIAYMLGISMRDMHIGNLDYEECLRVEDYLKERGA